MSDIESELRQLAEQVNRTYEPAAARADEGRYPRTSNAGRNRAILAVPVAVFVLVVGLVLVGARRSPSSSEAGFGAASAWASPPASPLGDRASMDVFNQSGGFIAWGGKELGSDGTEVLSGARFDTQQGTWTALPPIDLPKVNDAVSLWTGTSLLVFSNGVPTSCATPTETKTRGGARLDLASGAWSDIAPDPFQPGCRLQGAWDGARGVLFEQGPGKIDVAAYDPTRNVWSALPALPNSARLAAVAANHGTSFAVVGHELFILRPGAAAWEPWTEVGAGVEALLVAGDQLAAVDTLLQQIILLPIDAPAGAVTTSIPIAVPLAARTKSSICASTTSIVIWGGSLVDPATAASEQDGFSNAKVVGDASDGSILEVADRRWTTLPTSGAPTERSRAGASCDAGQFTLWGGDVYGPPSNYMNNGGTIRLP